MRDQGKGRQVLVAAFIVALSLLSLLGLCAKALVNGRNSSEQMYLNKDVSTGAVADVGVVTESAVSGGAVEKEQMQVGTSMGTSVPVSVDTSGLDSFHGFMSDQAYENLEQELVAECQKRSCSSIKKLNYQQTTEGTFDVASFVLLADGSIYQCDYNLKSDVSTIKVTNYSEADILAMDEAEKTAEQNKLEKQQKADKKKAAAKKKAKNKKKSKSKKKVSKGKSAKKK